MFDKGEVIFVGLSNRFIIFKEKRYDFNNRL